MAEPLPLPPIQPSQDILYAAIAAAIIMLVLRQVVLARWRRRRPGEKLLVIDPTTNTVKLLDAKRVANVLIAQDEDEVLVAMLPPEVKGMRYRDGSIVYPVIAIGEVGFPGNPEDFIAMSVLSLADDTDNLEEFLRTVSEITSRHIDVNVAGVKVGLPFNLSKAMKQYIAFNMRNVANAFSTIRVLSANMEYLKQIAEATEKIARARERILTTIALIITIVGFIAAIIMSAK